MKVLIVTNLYPPHYVGGYEIRCAQVAEALRQGGHDVQVLTSVFGLPRRRGRRPRQRRDEIAGVVVHRSLHQYVFPPWRRLRPWTLFQARDELHDARQLQRVIADFRPDVVNWWSMYGLSKLLLPLPGRWGIPDVHWIEHWWMLDELGRQGDKPRAFWAQVWEGRWGPDRLRPLLRAGGSLWEGRARRAGLETRDFAAPPRHVCFVSEYMARLHEEAGLELPSSEVIHGGVPTTRFYAPARPGRDAEPLRLLYAGQLSADRGLHTIVEALSRVEPVLRARLTLRVAGHGPDDYVARVRSQVERQGLADLVSFTGKIPHEQMPALYREHDVLVFASARPEGLPLTMVEAMLSGCAVLTTGAGGAREIAELARLPTFPANDPASLAGLLAGLVTDRAEVYRVASEGQRVALDEFSMERMMGRFTGALKRLAGQPLPSTAAALASRGALGGR